jgi:hypothetical protein
VEFSPDTPYTNLADWVRIDAAGYHLLDPADRSPLDPDTPHQWISADPRLARGFDFLRSAGSVLRLNLNFCRHIEAEDLGPDGTFEQRVAASDAYGFEGLGWNRRTFYQSLGQYAMSEQVEPLYPRPFEARVWRAAAQAANTHSFGFDIENTKVPLDNMLDEWCEAKGPWNTAAAPSEDRGPWMLTTNAMREWYMVGKTGYELTQLAVGQLPPAVSRFNAMMTVGSEHGDLARKFRLFGVDVATDYLRPEVQANRKVVETAMRHGRLTSDLL